MEPMERLEAEYGRNLEALAANEYPGRFIAQGVSIGGDFALQVYAIMGRNPGSKNRILEVFQDGVGVGVKTAPFEEVEDEDHSLTIYNAMRQAQPRFHVVSNGHQTDDLVDTVRATKDTYRAEPLDSEHAFMHAQVNWGPEPDPPIVTARISAYTAIHGTSRFVRPYFGFAVAADEPKTHKIIRNEQQHLLTNSDAGEGWCVHTYEENAPSGQPIPAFKGGPRRVPMGEDAASTAELYWNTLNPSYLVSLAVKQISLDGAVVDRANKGVDIVLKNKHLGD